MGVSVFVGLSVAVKLGVLVGVSVAVEDSVVVTVGVLVVVSVGVEVGVGVMDPVGVKVSVLAGPGEVGLAGPLLPPPQAKGITAKTRQIANK